MASVRMERFAAILLLVFLFVAPVEVNESPLKVLWQRESS